MKMFKTSVDNRQMDKNKVLKKLVKIIKEYPLAVLLTIIVIIVSLTAPSFFTPKNFENILKQVSVIGIVACGSAFVLLCGMIDLSVGSVVSLTGVAFMMFNMKIGLLLSIAISLGIGILCGTLTGVIIAFGGKKGTIGVSFIVSYGMLSIYAALTRLISGGIFQKGDLSDPQFSGIGAGITPIIIFLAIIGIGQFILVKTKAGRKIKFTGMNEEATRFSGTNTTFYRAFVYVISGFCSAIAAIVLASRVGGASPLSGSGFEIDALAGIIVGGVSLSGGKGSILNVLFGVIIIGVLSNALNMIGIATYPQIIIKGVVILLAVILNVISLQDIKLERK